MAENLETQALIIKQVPIGNAWVWIVKGFHLFKANPAMWIILLVLYLAIMIPVSMLPVIGSVVSTLLAPVFAAGMMWGCQALVKNQDLEINHLFEGFKKNTAQLISIGGIYMVSLLLVAVIVVLALDKETAELLVQGKDLSPEQADGMLMPIMIALLLIMPVLMAYWFAPVLAGLHHLSAIEAMKLSFAACLKNMLPFLLYGLIFMVLLIVAIIPFGLGLVVVVPMMMTSLYSSYADVFGIESTIPAPPDI
ncbi:BPSS1780 family membrane protein [Methylotenera sp. G11]|uniref:BPSS1780 family membrane protein n=1 Tax=Methylotenera sp. G11 TaxID=1506585 RepID=UPI000646A092|nr:BPSS1780 family membrane protein [Methylotenera sp. G11]